MPGINTIETGRQRPPEWGSARVFHPTVPDISDKIIRLGDHPTEAGSFADVYKCRYEGNVGIKEVCVSFYQLNPATSLLQSRWP